MNPFILAAFQDEMEKIAISSAPAKQQHSETPASKANAFFGLPLGPPYKKGTKDYDQGSAAAQSPDRSQQPIDAQSSANVSSGGAMYPASGPGGA